MLEKGRARLAAKARALAKERHRLAAEMLVTKVKASHQKATRAMLAAKAKVKEKVIRAKAMAKVVSRARRV